MRSMKKTAKILALVLGAAYAIGAAGCGEKEKTYDIPKDQYGFVCKPVDYGDMEVSAFGAAYRILEEEYEKENVTIQAGYGTFSLGDRFDIGTMVCRAEFFNDEARCTIAEIPAEEFFSKAYFMDVKIRQDGLTVNLFRHIELLQIPEELFSESSGRISFGFDIYLGGDLIEGGAGFSINYRMTGDKVVLTVPERYFG